MRSKVLPLLFLASLPALPAAAADQLFQTPESDYPVETKQLAYVESYDDVDGEKYAVLAYSEEDMEEGEWELNLKVQGQYRRKTFIKPYDKKFRRKLASAAMEGKDYLIYGYHMSPSDNDPRRLENRVFFNESMQPKYLEIHLVTRDAGGSARDEKVARVDFPDPEKRKLLSAPQSDGSTKIEELAYLHSYDVIARTDYAYLAYKETDMESGKWMLRVKGKGTASSHLKPYKRGFKEDIREAAREGRDYMVWGFRIEPDKRDPRVVENRVYFDDSLNPTHVEMHLVTRNGDRSARERKVARFDWPG